MQTPNPMNPETCRRCGKRRVRTLGQAVSLCTAISLLITEGALPESHPGASFTGYRAGLRDALPPGEHTPHKDPTWPPSVRIAETAITTAHTGPFLLKV